MGDPQTVPRGVGFRNRTFLGVELLRTQFRPEFLNRLDGVVTFESLKPQHMRQVLEIQLERVRPRLGERDLQLQVTDEAKQLGRFPPGTTVVVDAAGTAAAGQPGSDEVVLRAA